MLATCDLLSVSRDGCNEWGCVGIKGDLWLSDELLLCCSELTIRRYWYGCSCRSPGRGGLINCIYLSNNRSSQSRESINRLSVYSLGMPGELDNAPGVQFREVVRGGIIARV